MTTKIMLMQKRKNIIEILILHIFLKNMQKEYANYAKKQHLFKTKMAIRI